jgi:hypothetical protein
MLLKEMTELHITLWLEGEKLRYRGPKEVLTPELLGQLKESKPEIIEALNSEVVESTAEVLEIAREVLPPLAGGDRVDLDELIQANKPPEPGRDPMTKHDTAKAHFFHPPADCNCDVCMPLPKYARRRDAKTYNGDDAA